ncbi:glycosyltransferase [Microbacterium sp. GXF0217]
MAHNIPRADVEHSLADLLVAHPGRIRIEELHDGIPSPSGPFNFGMAESDADYVGIMGSDDELDPGAVTQWRRTAERHGADAVIAKVVRGDLRNLVRSPPKRLFRTGRLDFERDRLSYRSAPLGLMRREAVSRLQLRLLEGARNGGDLPFVTRLWLRGRVVPAQGLAAYVEHADAPVRVTHVAKPVAEELAPVRRLLASEDVRSMTRGQREALATKLFRRNLTDSIRKRDGGRGFTVADIAEFRALIETLDEFAPRARAMLAIAHARMFDVFLTEQPDLDDVARHDAAAQRYRSPDAILPRRLHLVLHSQAQPRFMLASGLIKVGSSRYFPAARSVFFVGIGLVAVAVIGLMVRSLGR